MVDILGGFYGVATGQGIMGWVGLGINLIVSTIVGGIVLLVLLQVLSKVWDVEEASPVNAFMAVLIINLINFFGILGLVGAFLPGIVLILLPIIIWIALMIALLGMDPVHGVVVGIVGWLVSSMIVPGLVSMVMGFMPI